MIFQIFPSYIHAVGSPDELAALGEELTFDLGEKRGKHLRMSLFDPVARSFPVGLLAEAESSLRSRGVLAARNDLRSRPAAASLPLSWLLPHQRLAVDALLRERVGCIDVPTAGGKGEIIAALCMVLQGPGLVLCDDIKVAHQLGDPKRETKEKSGRIAWRTGEEPGLVGDGKWKVGRVTVCSTATLDQHFDGSEWSDKARQLLAGARWVLYDEVHMSGAPRNQRILRACSAAVYRGGFSGTVHGRSDMRDAAVRAQLGPTIYKIPAAELEARGVTAHKRVRMIRHDHPGAANYDAGGYQEAVSLSRTRNAKVAAVWKKQRTGILTFVEEIDHGRYLLKIAESLGLRAEFLHGEHDTNERDAAITRFESGETAILISSRILKQGADLIHVYEVVNAGAKKAPIGTVQLAGRGGRVCRAATCARCDAMGKKTSVVITDFYDLDSTAEEAARRKRYLPGRWLRRHANLRKKAFEEKGMLVEVIDASEI